MSDLYYFEGEWEQGKWQIIGTKSLGSGEGGWDLVTVVWSSSPWLKELIGSGVYENNYKKYGSVWNPGFELSTGGGRIFMRGQCILDV